MLNMLTIAEKDNSTQLSLTWQHWQLWGCQSVFTSRVHTVSQACWAPLCAVTDCDLADTQPIAPFCCLWDFYIACLVSVCTLCWSLFFFPSLWFAFLCLVYLQREGVRCPVFHSCSSAPAPGCGTCCGGGCLQGRASCKGHFLKQFVLQSWFVACLHRQAFIKYFCVKLFLVN